MAKLVLLSEGMTGRTHELVAEKTTVGRVEENTFQIADPSVSSRHAEILLRGSDVVIKDLNSTNGTFIDGQQISGEAVLKSGQVLRLGQIQMRLESGVPGAPGAPTKKSVDQTMIMPRGKGGVSLGELEKGPQGSLDTKVFAKKTNKGNKWFLIGGIILGVIIIGGLIYALKTINK